MTLLPSPFEPTLDYARHLDQADPLAKLRQAFVIDDPELLYMDGNSLGRLPRRTLEVTHAVLRQQWGERLIRSWGEGWYEAPRRAGDKIGRLVGAAPGQVVVSDSTSVNLYKLVMAALALRPERSKLVTDTNNFPSDVYILQGCVQRESGRRLALVDVGDGAEPDQARLLEAIDEDTALVTLSQVVFKSGWLYDVQAITRRAHEAGALVVWDLSHSVGVVPIELDAWQVDFATGCTYKYLNGGPGAPAFLYANQALQSQALSPIWGWFGEAAPFAFDLDYHPAGDIGRFLCGTPPVLSLLAMEAGVDLLLEVGIEPIRQKSMQQTEYLLALADHRLMPHGFRSGSPRDPARRGSHVSLLHPEGYRINRALIEQMKVIPDFREPDHLRLGIAPAYTKYEEIWETAERIAQVMERKSFLNYPTTRRAVT